MYKRKKVSRKGLIPWSLLRLSQVWHDVYTFSLKGELNAISNLFLFESIGMSRITLKFFLKLKSNYIEQLNIETKKTL